MDADESMEDRLGSLEERVAALESATREPAARQGAGHHSAPTTSDPARHGDPLWVLAGLRQREPDANVVLVAGSVTVPNGQVAHWQLQHDVDALFASDFGERADSLAALSHPVRLRMLQRFLTDARSVQDLLAGGAFGTSGQIYHHLRQLVAAGWLHPSGGARYEVPAPRIVPLLAMLSGAHG